MLIKIVAENKVNQNYENDEGRTPRGVMEISVKQFVSTHVLHNKKDVGGLCLNSGSFLFTFSRLCKASALSDLAIFCK